MKIREPDGNEFDRTTERCSECDGHWRHYPACRLYAENETHPTLSPEEAETIVLVVRNHLGRLASSLSAAWGADRMWEAETLVERIQHVRGLLIAMGRKDIADGYDVRKPAELKYLREVKK